MKHIFLPLGALAIVFSVVFVLIFFTQTTLPERGFSLRGDEVVEINCVYKNTPGNEQVKGDEGILRSIFVASADGQASFKLWDESITSPPSFSTVLVSTFILNGATMYDFGAGVGFTKGLFITASGTVDATVCYR